MKLHEDSKELQNQQEKRNGRWKRRRRNIGIQNARKIDKLNGIFERNDVNNDVNYHYQGHFRDIDDLPNLFIVITN